MKSLREYTKEAEEKKVAIGHFNISNLEGFWAVVNTVKKLGVPAIIGVSEGERDFVGIKQVKALVDTAKQENLPVFLNADHSYSVDRVKEVIDAGFDAAIIDGAEKSFEENLKITKESVEYKNQANPNALVEAELGFIGKSSKILDEIPEGAGWSDEMMTKPEEALEFVGETGIDLFAPAVGNIHGMVKSGHNPKLNIERIRQIKEAVKIPLVLHGGSGISDEDFKKAIEAGISIIHINTEIRLAYKQGLQRSLSENPDEIAPYKYLRPALQEMQLAVEKRLALFNNL
ncbi:MAG TPA: class II fructose-bisphosphate aldolase [Candidatus Paceibacterota bacterium]